MLLFGICIFSNYLLLAKISLNVFFFRTPHLLGWWPKFSYFGNNSFRSWRFWMLYGDSEEYKRLGVLSMYSRSRQRNSSLHCTEISSWSQCGLHDSFRRGTTNVGTTWSLSKCWYHLVSEDCDQRYSDLWYLQYNLEYIRFSFCDHIFHAGIVMVFASDPVEER